MSSFMNTPPTLFRSSRRKDILRLSLLCVMLALGFSLMTQGPLTTEAIEMAGSGRLDEAEQRISQAMASEESRDPMTWYVQGFILKEIYVAEGRLPESPRRLEAVEAALGCAERDTEGAMTRWLRPLLSFLGDTYLDDARAAIPSVQPGTPVEAEALFGRYVSVRHILDPEWDEEAEWVLLNQQLGEAAFAESALLEREKAGPWFELGNGFYDEAAAHTHDRYRSMYNLAVHTYNQGVREFKAAEDDLDAIDDALNRAARHWNAASDILEDALSQFPDRSDGYEALAVVSEALLNQDRIEWCKTHIEELGGR